MTKAPEQAIAKVRTLPDEDQDALGVVLLSLAEEWPIGANGSSLELVRLGSHSELEL